MRTSEGAAKTLAGASAIAVVDAARIPARILRREWRREDKVNFVMKLIFQIFECDTEWERFEQNAEDLHAPSASGAIDQTELFLKHRFITLRSARGSYRQQYKHVMAHLLHIWGAHEFAF